MDLKKRIRELAQAADVQTSTPKNQCWVDAQVSCPYGNPEGQYILRPQAFCSQQCCHLPQELALSDDTTLKDHDAQVIQDHFKEHHTTVSSTLRVCADTIGDSAQELSLKLAADILDEMERDIEILIEDE